MSKYLLKLNTLLFFFIAQISFAQLSNFTLTVTNTNETCTANGTLFFNVSGTTAGATMVYSVYKLPNITTPIAILAANSIGGLYAGNYLVIATQSFAGNSGTQQQNSNILNQVVPLSYQILGTNAVCGNDGSLTINTTIGNAVSYEIFAGPMIRSLQASNIFSNLAAGQYSVRVFDACGEGVVQVFTLGTSPATLVFGTVKTNILNCTTINLNIAINAPTPNTIAFPLNVQITVNPPSGLPIIYNQIINSGIAINQNIAFYNNQVYSYTIHIVDRCGNIYNISNNQINTQAAASFILTDKTCIDSSIDFKDVVSIVLNTAPSSYPLGLPQDYSSLIIPTFNTATITHLAVGQYSFTVTNVCGNQQVFIINIIPDPKPLTIYGKQLCGINEIHIENITAAILTSAPTTFSLALPHDYTSLIDPITYSLILTNMPNGTYIFDILDSCGNPNTLSVTLSFSTPVAPIANIREGCANGFGTVYIPGTFVSVIITVAPANYSFPLPHNVSFGINSIYNIFTLNNLPAGNYNFQITAPCGLILNTPVAINGYTEINNINIIPHCGAFDIDLHAASNNQPYAYWLQKLNTTSNQWEHPITGVAYTTGTNLTITNAISLNNNAINYNFATTGQFRILSVSQVYMNGTFFYLENCIKTIHQFTFTGQPKINDIYTFSCNNGTYDAVVDAIGLAPLLYRITQKNGVPFVIQNGSSSVFLGLPPANYNFQVEDACHNILNSAFDIPRPFVFAITPTSFCNGNSGSLTVPDFPFLQYQWWKDNYNAIILSTTNTLNFPSFNAATQAGIYHVRIIYSANTSSCINAVMDYNITGLGNNPNAGTASNAVYCGNPGSINLFTKLSGMYDTGGVWTEITSSGMLSSNIWNATTVAIGRYQFQYKVTSACGTTAQTIVTIDINPVPTTPTATTAPTVCIGQPINLFASTVVGATYSWTGPNGFTSNLQNPTISNAVAINAGNYTVKANTNGCNSTSSQVSITIIPTPKAGNPTTSPYCGNPGSINLFTKLSGVYDTGGVWTEITSSGMLSSNIWNATTVAIGRYQFQYKITSACGTTAQTIVTIDINPVPTTPIATSAAVVCIGQPINLFASTVVGATYTWTGPNGFISNLQNPTISNAVAINAGNYTVKATLNGCISNQSTATVATTPLPEFSLNAMCINNLMTITASPIANSYNPNTTNFSWTGPNSFATTGNPILITNKDKGIYKLTITNLEGCATTQPINILYTTCTIPKGVSANNDGDNETFDLSGFGNIPNLKIYNRYGMIVFDYTNYTNQWHGQDLNDNPLPSATYYYYILMENGEQKTGWVYLTLTN